jgi:F-type H+-transporting ATPase subunit epsilon
MLLDIVTPDRKLISGMEMEEVFVPAHKGELNILPGHSPLVSTLHPGVLKYRLKGSSDIESVAISWGYIQITSTGVSILAETAEGKEDIDLDAVKKELSDLEKSLETAETPEEIVNYNLERQRAEARFEVGTH